MDIINYVRAKKLMLLRNVCVMKDGATVKRVLVERANVFNNDISISTQNKNFSPVFETINTSIDFDLYNECMAMINNDAYYSKIQWKEVVWGKAWAAERHNRNYQLLMNRDRYIFDSALGDDGYLSWWLLADLRICEIWVCETMAKIGRILCIATSLSHPLAAPGSSHVLQLLSAVTQRVAARFLSPSSEQCIIDCSALHTNSLRKLHKNLYKYQTGK